MAILKKIAVFVFSIWVIAASFVTMTIGAVGALLLICVGVPFRKSHRWMGGLSLALCPRYTFSRFDLIFDPEHDKERRSVYAQNHVSVMDGHLACMTIPHSFCGLHLASHFKIPAYGWIMKMALGIPVYPRSSGRTAEITAAAKDRIEDKNISILVFPEAHRTRTGQVQEFKRGVFFMARDAGIPVVPLAVRGMFDVNHAGSWKFRPGKVQIYVGKQIETAGMSDEEITQLAVDVKKLVADFVEDGVLPERVLKERPELRKAVAA